MMKKLNASKPIDHSHKLQYITVQYNTVQNSTLHYSIVRGVWVGDIICCYFYTSTKTRPVMDGHKHISAFCSAALESSLRSSFSTTTVTINITIVNCPVVV